MISSISRTTPLRPISAIGKPVPGNRQATSTMRRIACANCSIENFVELNVPLDHALCARCGEPLVTKKVVDLTPKRLARQLQGTDMPVVVLFWSPARYPDYSMSNEFAIAAAHLAGKARFCNIDVSEYPGAAIQAHTEHVPVLVIYQNGVEQARWTHEIPAPSLIDWLKSHLPSA